MMKWINMFNVFRTVSGRVWHSMLAKINKQVNILDNSRVKFKFVFVLFFPVLMCPFEILKGKLIYS